MTASSAAEVDRVAQADMSVSVRRSMNLVALDGRPGDGGGTSSSTIGAGDITEVTSFAV